MTSEISKNEKLIQLLTSKRASQILKTEISLGDVVIHVDRKNIFEFLELLKIDSELQFGMLTSLTAVDWMDSRENRFEMVYHLLSLKYLYRLVIKSEVPEVNPEIASVVSLWAGANFLEREVWDMYGIKFSGHPDLRRILMYDEFIGHPLRKDYPLQAKQPRVKLRYPEVRNTAVDMQRPDLVKISSKKKSENSKPHQVA